MPPMEKHTLNSPTNPNAPSIPSTTSLVNGNELSGLQDLGGAPLLDLDIGGGGVGLGGVPAVNPQER